MHQSLQLCGYHICTVRRCMLWGESVKMTLLIGHYRYTMYHLFLARFAGHCCNEEVSKRSWKRGQGGWNKMKDRGLVGIVRDRLAKKLDEALGLKRRAIRGMWSPWYVQAR